jgi:hypothetical protein
MIAVGAPITEVAHRLGHASPAITLEVYAHFLKDTEGSTTDQLANVILNGGAPPGKLEKSGHLVGTHGARAVAAIAVSA